MTVQKAVLQSFNSNTSLA